MSEISAPISKIFRKSIKYLSQHPEIVKSDSINMCIILKNVTDEYVLLEISGRLTAISREKIDKIKLEGC